MLKKTLAPLLFLSLSSVSAMETSQDDNWDDIPNPFIAQNVNNQNANPDISRKSKRNNAANDKKSEPDHKKRKVEPKASQIDINENIEMIVETTSSINYEEDLEKMYRCIQYSPESQYFQELGKFGSEKYKNIDMLDYYNNLLTIQSNTFKETIVNFKKNPQNNAEIIIEAGNHLSVLTLCTERIRRALELKKMNL